MNWDPTVIATLLNPYTRARGVGVIHDRMRAAGKKYDAIVVEIQRLHVDAGVPAPSVAEIDWWLEESEIPTT